VFRIPPLQRFVGLFFVHFRAPSVFSKSLAKAYGRTKKNGLTKKTGQVVRSHMFPRIQIHCSTAATAPPPSHTAAAASAHPLLPSADPLLPVEASLCTRNGAIADETRQARRSADPTQRCRKLTRGSSTLPRSTPASARLLCPKRPRPSVDPCMARSDVRRKERQGQAHTKVVHVC
jgi:hypothetical protein